MHAGKSGLALKASAVEAEPEGRSEGGVKTGRRTRGLRSADFYVQLDSGGHYGDKVELALRNEVSA